MAFLCPQPKAPATPDYAAAATAQGEANIDTAKTQGYLNNPNVIGPLGGQTVTFDPITNQPTITQNLTPTAQATLDAQQRVQQGMANLGEQGLASASGIISKPFEYSGPGGIFSLGNAGNIQGAPDLSGMGSASGGFTGDKAYGNVTGGTAQGNVQSGQAYGAVDNGVAQGSVANPQASANFQGGQAVGGVYGGMARGNFRGGTATGGVNGPTLQDSYGNYGAVQGSPDLGAYGSASSIGAGQYGLSGGINPSQYGMAQGGVEGVNLQQSLGNTGQINQNLNANNYLANNQLNLSNVAQMPVNAGTTGQAAIMSRLAPQLERQQKLTAQSLANQGLVAGGEAYTNAMRDQSQQQNDLLTQAALQGISLDTAANQQGFNQALSTGQFGNLGTQQNFANSLAAQQAQNAAQGQGFNQQLQSGQFGNQAQLASFGANLQNQQAQNQAIAKNYGQGLTSQQLSNQAVGQNFGQGQTASNAANASILQNQNAASQQQQLANAAQLQQYNQNLGSAQFANSAATQDLQTQLALRNQPLNEITGLMSGSQLQMPQFQGYNPTSIAPAPVFAGAQAQGAADMQKYGIEQSGANALTSGLFSLGGAGVAKYSDRRLKSNIERIGTHKLGIGIYEYDIFGERQQGVMADEVEKIMPEAVLMQPSGYKMVNYGLLNG